MKAKKSLVSVLMAVVFVLGLAGAAMAAWGTAELDTEKVAVTFAAEVERGGYKIVATQDLKKWIDAKKPMLIVDTMPFEASYKKQHVPGAVQHGRAPGVAQVQVEARHGRRLEVLERDAEVAILGDVRAG